MRHDTLEKRMPVFGSPDIKKLKFRQDIHRLIKALNTQPDSKIRKAAVLALGDMGAVIRATPKEKLAIAALSNTLQNDSEDILIRLLAIDSLLNVGSSGVILPLVEGMKLDNRHISNIAFNALETQGFRPFIHAVTLAKINLYAKFGAPWGYPDEKWRVFFSPECQFMRLGDAIEVGTPDCMVQSKWFSQKSLIDLFLFLMRQWGPPEFKVVDAMKLVLRRHAGARALPNPPSSYDPTDMNFLLADYDQLFDLYDGMRSMTAGQYVAVLDRFTSKVEPTCRC
jgi:hypothetical protein